MLRRQLASPFMLILLGGACLSLAPGNTDNQSSTSRSYPENVTPGVSDDNSNSQRSRNQSTDRQEVAYMDNRDEDIHQRAYRMGDWDNQENWRYDRKAFYRGETQPQSYREEHPYGPAGIGYDADDDNRYRDRNRDRNSSGYSNDNRGNNNRSYGNGYYNSENGFPRNDPYNSYNNFNRNNDSGYSNDNRGNNTRSSGNGYSNNDPYKRSTDNNRNKEIGANDNRDNSGDDPYDYRQGSNRYSKSGRSSDPSPYDRSSPQDRSTRNSR